MNKILVYTDGGLGASPACVRLVMDGVTKSLNTLQARHSSIIVETITANEIFKGCLSNDETKLLIMPGGRDRPYCQYLNGHGNHLIREFIKTGGSYLGLCAGGYYGCEAIEFAKGDIELEICEQRELQLYPGIAIGPVFPGFCYTSMKGARPVTLAIDDNSIIGRSMSSVQNRASNISVYYNGGPYFTPPRLSCKTAHVLASYSSTGEAAIVHSVIGSGRVILCGPHVEASVSSLSNTYVDDVCITDLVRSVETTEDTRNSFFTAIVKYLVNS